MEGVPAMFEEYPVFLSVQDICEILYIDKHAVYKLIHSGKLRAFRTNNTLWRVPKEALAEYVLTESNLKK